MPVTLTQLTTRSKQLADMVGSSFVGSTEWTDYINSGYGELYDLVVASFEDYFTTTATSTITTGNAITLPNDFYKIRGLDFLIGSQYVNCTLYNFNDRNAQSTWRSSALYNQSGRQYRIIGDTVYIIPQDNALGDYRVWYVPALVALSNGADFLPTSLTKFGWEEYICLYAAERALNKQESDVTVISRQRQELASRIVKMAENRNIDQPERITDLQSTNSNSLLRDFDGN